VPHRRYLDPSVYLLTSPNWFSTHFWITAIAAFSTEPVTSSKKAFILCLAFTRD
jgi:hypothetical protein